MSDPLPTDDTTLTRGVRLYGTHCAMCHGTSDGQASSVAKGLYQRPPQFAKHDVTDDPVEETYWKITHGNPAHGHAVVCEHADRGTALAIATFLRHQASWPRTPMRHGKRSRARRPATGTDRGLAPSRVSGAPARDLCDRRPILIRLAVGDRIQQIVTQHAGEGQRGVDGVPCFEGEAHVLEAQRELEAAGS